MILAHSPIVQLGVDESRAVLRFGEEPKPAWAGRRDNGDARCGFSRSWRSVPAWRRRLTCTC